MTVICCSEQSARRKRPRDHDGCGRRPLRSSRDFPAEQDEEIWKVRLHDSFVYFPIVSTSEIPMVPRWNRKNRRTVRYICKSQFMFWLIITLVFLNTIIQVGNIAWQSRWQCSWPGNGAPSPAWVVGRLPGVHQPHLPLPLHRWDAHEDVRYVILGERDFLHIPFFETLLWGVIISDFLGITLWVLAISGPKYIIPPRHPCFHYSWYSTTQILVNVCGGMNTETVKLFFLLDGCSDQSELIFQIV